MTVIFSLSPLIARKSDNYRVAIEARNLERKPSKKKRRTDTKKDAKRLKSDNFTRSNREKFNNAVALLKKIPFLKGNNNYFAF